MPEALEHNDSSMCSIFIWYHADTDLLGELQQWVEETAKQFGIAARLMIRKQPAKTTMMEIYELPFSDTARIESLLADIEARAQQQSWFSQLTSPRRAEVFALADAESIEAGSVS